MKIGTEIRFIRYGRPPMSGRSTNFATGEVERLRDGRCYRMSGLAWKHEKGES